MVSETHPRSATLMGTAWSRRILFAATGVMLLSACAPAASLPSGPRPVSEPEKLREFGGLLGDELAPLTPSVIHPVVTYDLPMEANRWVEAEIQFLLQERSEVVRRWMARADVYRDFVVGVFRDYGIPTDLYHLAMIESGFVSSARSRAGAVGMWQFMPATGRDEGLRVDDSVDERMDPVRSTRAAALHLRRLYRAHGDWSLAIAAYNAGSGRISRGLERSGTSNFWDLAQQGDLAEETRRYVPRLYAVTIIAKDRERFGFFADPNARSFAFDSVYVEGGIPIAELAELGGVEPAKLAELNPHLLEGRTPREPYWVWAPHGSAEALQRGYLVAAVQRQSGLISFAANTSADDYAMHVVEAGDTLWEIARRYGTTVEEIELANKLGRRPIRPGQNLSVPVSTRQ